MIPDFGIADIRNIDWEEKVRVGENNFLLMDMDITLSMSGAIKTKLELSTVI